MREVIQVSYDEPVLRLTTQPGIWQLAQDWDITVRSSKNGVFRLHIDAGYWTDLASVPRWLMAAFDNGTVNINVMAAALVHDALYSTQWMSKEFADKMFHTILRSPHLVNDTDTVKPVGAAKAQLYYTAVDWFGGSPYYNCDPRQRSIDRDLIPCPKWDAR